MNFDYSILKSKVEYSKKKTYGLIKGVYNEYVKKHKILLVQLNRNRNNKEEAIINRIILKEEYIKM